MKRLFLVACSAVLILTSSSALAGRHGHHARSARSADTRVRSTITRSGPVGTRHAVTTRNSNRSRNWNRSANWNRPRNWSASQNWNGNRHRRHHHHHHGSRFVFIGSFGYPYYWYPYYSYYPSAYSYYSSDYGAYSNAQPSYENNSYEGRGSIVVEVQRRLAREGYYQGAIDGVMGSRTHYAIRAYERAHGLSADGEIDDQLLGAMGLR